MQYQFGSFSYVAFVCVQFWDYRQPRKYLNILSCQVPVWKARYTVGLAPPALVLIWFTERHTIGFECENIPYV